MSPSSNAELSLHFFLVCRLEGYRELVLRRLFSVCFRSLTLRLLAHTTSLLASTSLRKHSRTWVGSFCNFGGLNGFGISGELDSVRFHMRHLSLKITHEASRRPQHCRVNSRHISSHSAYSHPRSDASHVRSLKVYW